MRYYRPMMMSPTPSTSALVVLRRYHVVCRPIFEWRSGYQSLSKLLEARWPPRRAHVPDATEEDLRRMEEDMTDSWGPLDVLCIENSAARMSRASDVLVATSSSAPQAPRRKPRAGIAGVLSLRTIPRALTSPGSARTTTQTDRQLRCLDLNTLGPIWRSSIYLHGLTPELTLVDHRCSRIVHEGGWSEKSAGQCMLIRSAPS